MTRQSSPRRLGFLGMVLSLASMAIAAPSSAQAPAAQPSPAGPPRTETVVYENWTVTCRDNLSKGAKKICSANLRIANNQTRQNILIWEIGNDAAGKPIFALRTPLGVMIKDGVQLTIDAGKARKVDYILCDANGCEAAGLFDAALSRELAGGSEASVGFMMTNGQPVRLKVPLKGAAQALVALRS